MKSELDRFSVHTFIHSLWIQVKNKFNAEVFGSLGVWTLLLLLPVNEGDV